MSDLFRYLTLRPPLKPDEDLVHELTASGEFSETLAKAGQSPAARGEVAELFVASENFVKSPNQLPSGHAVQHVVKLLGRTPPPDAAAINAAIKRATAEVNADQVEQDAKGLENSLIAAKLASTARGADVRSLSLLALAYATIRRSGRVEGEPAAGNSRVPEVLTLPATFEVAANDPPANPEGPGPDEDDEERRSRLDERLRALDDALAVLASTPIEKLVSIPRLSRTAAERVKIPAPSSADSRRVDDNPVQPREDAESHSGGIAGPSSWRLQQAALNAMPAIAREVLRRGDRARSTLTAPGAVEMLQQEKQAVMHQRSTMQSPEEQLSVVNIGRVGSLFRPMRTRPYLPRPVDKGLPQTRGALRPVGIGDLLIVRENTTGYIGGDVAHIQNVLKQERLTRGTRRLEKTEQSFLSENENTHEEERDTQTTDRFSLQRETNNTVKTDTEVKAGLAVSARYGPMVEVKANVDFQYSNSTEESVRTATSFGKDVVTRAATTLSEQVREVRSTTTSLEYIESNEHGFDNTGGDGHISGVYQWVDKQMQAQVYNYGNRLLFDVMIPEPAAFYIHAVQGEKSEGQTLKKPMPFEMTPAQIDESNYLTIGARYDTSNLNPPPPLYRIVAKAYDIASPEGTITTTKSDTFGAQDGYEATAWAIRAEGSRIAGGTARVIVANQLYAWESGTSTGWNLSADTSQIPVVIVVRDVFLFACTIEILTRRTERAMQLWQKDTHAAILQSFLVKQTEYERALSEAASSGVQINGRNPASNERIIQAELRKACLATLTAQQFDVFGALATSTQGFPELDLQRAPVEGSYIRFFEQAFEWDQLMYFFYPYFWGSKGSWEERALLDDTDQRFADFLRAGEARVVFPVRPGFEAAVLHYLDTGKIWQGGDPPEITSPLYVPILTEIKSASGAPGSEIPVGDPWEVRIPTTLVRLRLDDALPAWVQNDDGSWGEAGP